MVCGSCVEKLAIKLVTHHPRMLDLVLAMELAEKAIERYEQHKPKPTDFKGVRSVSPGEKQRLDFDPDYSAACSPAGYCACYGTSASCFSDLGCVNNDPIGFPCECDCPAPPKAHSHYVSNTCVSTMSYTCACNSGASPPRCYGGRSCTCVCSGLCYYSCDSGYAWNPVTELCELVAVAKQPLMDGLVYVE
jgi:hypothetical protein